MPYEFNRVESGSAATSENLQIFYAVPLADDAPIPGDLVVVRTTVSFDKHYPDQSRSSAAAFYAFNFEWRPLVARAGRQVTALGPIDAEQEILQDALKLLAHAGAVEGRPTDK